MKVLLAEDNPVSRRMVKAMLADWGHEVVLAEGGDAAWAVMQGPDAPKLVILDRIMPGVDGVEVCRRIRASDQANETYIILLTSMNRREDVVFGLEAGADDYVVKPFHRDELRARVSCGVRIVGLQSALAARVRELEAAVEHIQTLQGILPICMYCKKIRNDEDAWEKVETYIQNHSDAKFSHGLCPTCFDTHYDDEENEAA